MSDFSRKAIKVQIKNLPTHATREDIEHLISSTLGTGTAQKFEEGILHLIVKGMGIVSVIPEFHSCAALF